jgi:serine/threonine-protein kinase
VSEGTPFGRYRLIELLGRGGMGEVWRAYDTDTDRIVAIKLLPPHLSEDDEFQRRFRREAHAAARLNDPHVIPIHNYGEIDGRLYLDMRLIEGRDLGTVLAKGPLNPARAVRIIEQVAMALHAAHEVGLLHRDIKPSNVLVGRNDFAYLIDFGIARAADETRMTKSGFVIGTFQYIAPERLTTGVEEDERADIYSLTCVLYECLAGSPPFDGDTMARLVAAHLNTPPPRPTDAQPDVPPHLDEVIATGMAKDPDQRYATAVELVDAAHAVATTSRRATATTPEATTVDVQAPRNQAASQDERTVEAADRPSLRRRLRGRTLVMTAIVVLTCATVGVTGYLAARPSAHVTRPTNPLTSPTPTPRRTQITLPFTGLREPEGMAVDSAGAVYVADYGNGRVVSLPAGATPQTVLPFTGLQYPDGLAVDGVGNLYATDGLRVLQLPAGSDNSIVLPFNAAYTGSVFDVAVDTGGSVYVTGSGNMVLKLSVGAATPAFLPIGGLTVPSGVAVDNAGNVYVVDNRRVLKLAAASGALTALPFSGFGTAQRAAIDAVGNVYVSDYLNNKVLKLAAGSTTPAALPFTGLHHPYGVAVDSAGAVYVVDSGNNRVLKLPAA